MEHRILEFLAMEKAFAIEAHIPESCRVKDYVLTGEGGPKQLLADCQEWAWNTEEVVNMIRRMREFNASGWGPVQFTGFDMQMPDMAAGIVRNFLSIVDPDHVESVAAIHADTIRQTAGWAPYALAYGLFRTRESWPGRCT
jgi:erythromycin esterase-like protein